MNNSKYDYTFNQNDYECVIRLYNGFNDVYLKPEGWDNLYIDENIFDWRITGSIEIKTVFDSFERSSFEARLVTGAEDKELIYKFRNDGRDTIFISIIPKNNVDLLPGQFNEQKWRIEVEAVIYDVEDYSHGNVTNKIKKLYFHEKTFQMMTEKNVEFSTAIVGANKSNTAVHKLNNDKRSLLTGEALAELLLNDEDFKINAEFVTDAEKWDKGDEKNKIFYTSPSNYKFIDDLEYIYGLHTSSESNDYQPCILKFERAAKGGDPKQFTLMPIKKYFEKAGKSTPGEYQIEHLFLEEYSETSDVVEPVIRKAPLSRDTTNLNGEIKAKDFNNISSYQLVDLAGGDYSQHLNNRMITSFNDEKGQFNIEIKEHKAEKYKEFYQKNVSNAVLTEQKEDRLLITPFIKDGYNISQKYTPLMNSEQSRISEGRNKLIQYYMFTNLAIAFSLRGLTIRQPGRFFGLSKLTKNDKEYDNKLEGQYFITNVLHYFSNQERTYFTQTTGIKVHTFKELTTIPDDDALIIS